MWNTVSASFTYWKPVLMFAMKVGVVKLGPFLYTAPALNLSDGAHFIPTPNVTSFFWPTLMSAPLTVAVACAAMLCGSNVVAEMRYVSAASRKVCRRAEAPNENLPTCHAPARPYVRSCTSTAVRNGLVTYCRQPRGSLLVWMMLMHCCSDTGWSPYC